MYNRKAFTLIELLTSLVIIILLLGILLPSIATVRKMAKETAQKAQFATMDMALEAFRQDYGDYPDSNASDGGRPATLIPYCGAMKLAEAMVGRDIKGFNPNSRFYRNGTSDGQTPITWANNLYPANPGTSSSWYATYVDNIKSRRMYLQPERISVNLVSDIYTTACLAISPLASPYGPTDPGSFVLCDVFTRTMKTGNKTGMPILYYRANTNNVDHIKSISAADLDRNIYDSRDNVGIVDIPLPWCVSPWPQHPMARGGKTILRLNADPTIFYDKTRDTRVPTGDRPHNASTFILMSAGADNEFGTSDDIFNGF
jgi:type II secretory pathway pseudopilin PulG